MQRRIAVTAAVLAAAALLATACSTSPNSPAPGSTAAATHPTTTAQPTVPRWDHVVVVVMGSRSYREVFTGGGAPFLSLLARSGASFSNAYALSRAAQPNRLALFAGSTLGVTGEACPHTFDDPNLYTQLRRAGYSFAAFVQSLPRDGYRGCRDGAYLGADNPISAFPHVPPGADVQLREFPTDFTTLPDVSFVLPDEGHSMADTSVPIGDAWVRAQLARYATWASSNRSLLLITWDRSGDRTRHIPMLAIGANVTPGVSTQRVGHYQLVATLQDAFGVSRYAGTTLVAGIDALGG